MTRNTGKVLTPALKGKGRLPFGMQGDNFKAPLEHLVALYEAVKEYGGIDVDGLSLHQ